MIERCLTYNGTNVNSLSSDTRYTKIRPITIVTLQVADDLV